MLKLQGQKLLTSLVLGLLLSFSLLPAGAFAQQVHQHQRGTTVGICPTGFTPNYINGKMYGCKRK